MTKYQTADDIVAERFEALIASDRATVEGNCCAGCRRGTKELGQFPCGRTGRCNCHTGRNRT